MHQQQLNEGRNITLPPEVLAAIDQHLPEIMRQTCESKNTGKRFEMNLIEFNNKYIKKTYHRSIELNVIFHWDQMLKDPVMQEVKRQIDQLLQQQPNQIIKIVIDPKESEEMPTSLGWAKTNEIYLAHSEKPGENINKIIDDNRKNIIGILDKYYSDEFGTYMRKLQAENNQEEINKEINNFCFRGIRYYFYEEIQRKQTLGIVNINEKLMCEKPKEEMRTLLVHEIIHCIDPKLIYRADIVDPKYYQLQPKDDFSKIKKYKSNKVEIEANVGEMVQQIFDLVNNSRNYQKTKSQIETIAQELRGAPIPDLTNTSKNDNSTFINWIKNFYKVQNYISPLKSNPDFDIYTQNLTPKIKRKVLERLSNAVIQARQMLETKYKNKKI
jgi:hypothetical protein